MSVGGKLRFLIHFKPIQQRSHGSLVRIVERGKHIAKNPPQFKSIDLFLEEFKRRFSEVRVDRIAGNDVWIDIPGEPVFVYKVAQRIADEFFVELHRHA